MSMCSHCGAIRFTDDLLCWSCKQPYDDKIVEGRTRLGVINRIERNRNTANGNPQWHIGFTDGNYWATEPDGQVAYIVVNFQPEDTVLYTTAKGKICQLSNVPESYAGAK